MINVKNSASSKIGRSTVEQFSIEEKVNIKETEDLLLKNISVFEDFLKKNKDKYAKEIFDSLKKNKKLNFPFNKQMELFIKHNKKNIILIIKYLIFRYKFMKCGSDKVNFGYPLYLLIEPVSACNLRCPFCFQIDRSFTKKPYMGVMNFELFKKIVEEANKIGVGAITIASRGEPTLHKQITEMLEYVGKQENIFEIKLNTNGTFLNEKICHAIFKNKISLVVISADHYIKKDFERLRLNSNFEEVVKNTDQLFNIRKKYYPDSNTEIRISGIDNEKNLDRKKFKDFWIQRSDHVTASYPLERWNTYENEPHPSIKDPCENLWDRMYIWYDGKVNPCDADYKSYLSYGNYNDKSITEIWNDKIITKLRKDHLKENRNNIKPCDRCGVTFK
tara:strand:+ start:320 stop:1489 length:1170 start_codon:yes stop_codon:yes gene_type:complete